MPERLRTRLVDTYRACLDNAEDLLADAEFLFERGSYPRSYMLAFTAIEEISKSQLAADLFTGLISQEEFDRAFYSHAKKIDRIRWATMWAHGVFGELPEDALLPQSSDRMASLYVDIDVHDAPLSPLDRVSEEAAAAMIRTARAGLEKIARWEAFGGPIGTKGFMK